MEPENETQNQHLRQPPVSGSINLSKKDCLNKSEEKYSQNENKENWVKFVNKTLNTDFDESLSTEQHVRNAVVDESLGENVRNLSKLVVNELDRQQKLLSR